MCVAVVGTADAMKRATGMRTFDLDVGAEEMDDVVEELFKKKHTLQVSDYTIDLSVRS